MNLKLTTCDTQLCVSRSSFPGVAPGAVTNEASKGWLRLHKSKLIKIPEHMNNAVAAGFSIGSQTSTSMVRRVNLKQNERALSTERSL